MGKKQERDFKKVKEKGYGKKKQPANVVKTSFRTRQLVMPYQKVADLSRTVDRVQVTHRNLSLDEVVSKLSHHNHKTRRDALSGLKELVVQFPAILSLRLGAVLPSLLCQLEFAGQSERADAALVAAFETVLAAASEGQMQTHAGLVWVYVASALTHLHLETRLLGLRILDACLGSDACFRALDQASLLSSLAATLTNRFQSGISASSTATRLRIWSTVLRFQQRRHEIRRNEQLTAPSSSFAPLHIMYESREPLEHVSEEVILSLLVNEVFEHIPGSNAAMATLLLQSLALIVAEPALAASAMVGKCLTHLAGNFPLSQVDATSLNAAPGDFTDPNVRIAALLLRYSSLQQQQMNDGQKKSKKQKKKAALQRDKNEDSLLCSEEVIQFVATKLADAALDDGLRRVLLESCRAAWGAGVASTRGLLLAEAFAAFFGSRLSSNVRLDCLGCVEQLLCEFRKLPESLVISLLKGCARSLWQSASTAGAVINVLWSFVRRCPAAALSSQLLANFLVPVLSAEAVDGRIQQGSFHSFSPKDQCGFVRLFCGLAQNVPEKLTRAWLRCLADASTHSSASEALLRTIHNVRGFAFESMAKYFSFLGKVLFRQSCSVPRVVCMLIGDAVCPEHWPESSELYNAREVGLLAFEDHLKSLLEDPAAVANALLLMVMCDAPENFLAEHVQAAKTLVIDRSVLDVAVTKRFFK